MREAGVLGKSDERDKGSHQKMCCHFIFCSLPPELLLPSGSSCAQALGFASSHGSIVLVVLCHVNLLLHSQALVILGRQDLFTHVA